MIFTQCPRCAKQGKDTSKDNLAVYDDGHQHCFGGCGYHRRAPDSISNMARKMTGKTISGSSIDLNLEGCTQALPKEPLAWLRRYGITDEEIHQNQLFWNPERQHLVFPVHSGDRVVATCSRSFGPGPKYLTKGNTKHYKVFPAPTDVYVLVEDFVSAIKVGRHYNCIPLLGAHVSLNLILSLVKYQPRLRIWLDLDKSVQAVTYSVRASQYIKDVATIVTERDPKTYSDGEIIAHVSGTLEGVSELETYSKYGDYLDYQFIKENQPETFRLFQTVRYLQEKQSKQYSVDDVELTFATLYPQAKASDFAPLFTQLRTIEVAPEVVFEYLNTVLQRSNATTLAKLALGVAEGTKTQDELQTFLSSQVPSDPQQVESDFVETDIRIIHAKRLLQPGLRWRLDSLNKALGSIRKGNFGFIVARPETGKTTFLASEVTHMARSVTAPILWFNNEEEHEAVIYRLYQAAYGVDLPTLISRLDHYAESYASDFGKRIRLVTETPTTRSLVERMCKEYQPVCVIVDQIDKVQGFANDRHDLELSKIYGWAREIAKRYAPVIGVCQAGGTAEGKRWLTMNDIDNSKTGKPAEADWILGIGKVSDEGMETYRFLHLSKNKLPGEGTTDPALRHGRWEVRLRADIARYEDIA